MLLSDGTSIQTHTAIGGGGLMASPLAASAGLPRGRGGRIEVRPDLTGEGFPGVYALGNFADIPGRFRFKQNPGQAGDRGQASRLSGGFPGSCP